MGNFVKGAITIASGMGILIGLYLVLSKGKESASIISAIGGQTTSAVRALQGR